MSLPRMAARACVRPTSCRFNLTSSVMALCVLLSIFSRVIWAQDLQSSDDQNTIRGTVVNAITHLPIARALVHSGDDRYAVMSDSDGHFEFTGQPGEVGWLLARKPGFLGDLHTWRAIRASSGSEITITLMPESIIKGRVSTSTGETIPGIQVQLLAQRIQDGVARWTPAAMVQTKSDGSFRFAELTSGAY
ncbi:MAG TPA: carboxypeptidase-like regulatory domain-containing protein, partial [Terriglobales bacterium]|nr:carboxypeptidase-like regulatory domain-containing protein [Terriglobales bacterium]